MSVNLDVREVIEDNNKNSEPMATSATALNASVSDSFIKPSCYDANAAYARLAVIRKTMKQFQHDILMAGTDNMPKETIEMYETMKMFFRQIEAEEIKTIKESFYGRYNLWQ